MINCRNFSHVIATRAEHLDEEVIKAMHPIDTWIGHVSIGRFPALDGVEHTFDRFEQVFPDLRGTWEDVTNAPCVGTPCDPDMTTINMGFTRDSYKLQRKTYASCLVCFDQILSLDRAKTQYAWYVEMLQRAAKIIGSHRLRTEGLRISGQKWSLANNTLVPITATWDATMTFLTISTYPTSKLTARHLQRSVQPQIRHGALGPKLNKSQAPMLEFVTTQDEIWDLCQGCPELADHWRFTNFGTDGAAYYKYGWTGRCGNFGLRDDTFSLRFNLVRTLPGGGAVLQLVYPYNNISATQGIKENVNADFDAAPVQIDFIWHRDAMTSMVRDTTVINPEMPFAARDFGGKWMWANNNLTCGTDTNGNPIAVDNSWGNKGRFQAMWSWATKAEHPELAEVFVHLREPACIVDIPVCVADPGYPEQNYDSACEECSETDVVLTFTPEKNTATGGYDIAANTIKCNGMTIVHDAILGDTTLTLLVASLNLNLSELGTWAVLNATTIRLTGTVCASVVLPGIEASA